MLGLELNTAGMTELPRFSLALWFEVKAHLIFLQVTLLHHFVPLLLECDDDEGDEDVDEEEGEDYKVHNVEDGHLHAVASAWAVIFLGHVY